MAALRERSVLSRRRGSNPSPAHQINGEQLFGDNYRRGRIWSVRR